MPSSYIPPSVRAIREDIGATAVITGGEVVPCFIGLSNGTLSPKSAQSVVRGSGDTDTLADNPVASVAEIRTLATGGIVYKADVDYTFTDPNIIDWSAATVILPPYMFPAVAGVGGGTFAAGTYYYVVAATRITDVAASPTSATVSNASVGPFAVQNASTVGVKIDGAAATDTTFNGTAALRVSGNTQLTGFDLANGLTLKVKIDGAAEQTITFLTAQFVDITAATAMEIVDVINSFIVGAQAYVTGSTTTSAVNIRSDSKGLGSYVEVTGGTANTGGVNRLAFITSAIQGTGNVSNLSAVTAAEVRTLMNAALTGSATVEVLASSIKITRTATGLTKTLQVVSGSANDVFSFPTTLVAGTDAGGATVGETTRSNEVSVIVGLNGTVSLTWAPVPGASGYKIFRTPTTGSYGALSLLTTVTGESTNIYTDTGTATATGQPVSSNTALKAPASGVTYYVDYYVVATTVFTPKIYTSLTSALIDHGLGSDLAIAATLAMGTSGRGNEATQIVMMAIPDVTVPTFQAAFDILARRKDITIVVPCSSTWEVMDSLKAHCLDEEKPEKMNPKLGFVGPAKNVQIGDPSSSGTAVYQARALNHRRMTYCYPWPVMNVQQADGTFVSTILDGWASAAAAAGRVASLPDRAEPATGKQIRGITLGTDLDSGQMNILGSYGVYVLAMEDGNLIARDALTTTLDNEEDRHLNINLVDDMLIRNLDTNFRQYRGKKLLPKLLDLIELKTKDVLGKFVKFTLINFFDPGTVVAEQDTAIPTRILVRFSYAPIYPARIIEFRYSFDLRSSL